VGRAMSPTVAPAAPPACTATAAAQVEAELDTLAPELVAGFRAALPYAGAVVDRRLRGALHREGLSGAAPPAGARRHGFGRVEWPAEPGAPLTGPAAPLAGPAALAVGPGAGLLAAEIANAVVNLSLAYARRARLDTALRAGSPAGPGCVALTRAMAPDARLVFLERLATEGHNLHPCGRTRLGWRTADVLAHDLETDGSAIGFAAVHRAHHVGDDVGALLRDGLGDRVPRPPPGYAVQPVHAWQLDALRHAYPPEVVRPLDAAPLPAAPTAALRTLLLPAGTGPARYLKLSLDIQVTSTRRTISVASARNGPPITALLHRLLVGEPAVALLDEPAGAACGAGSGRDATAIVRTGLDAVGLADGEDAIPAVALPARCPYTGRPVLVELVEQYAASRGPRDAAARFLDEYARVLLPPVLRLATRYGVGLEAHLQNCVPTFRRGVPVRMVFRDFAGLRLHLPRLRARGVAPDLWPGSAVVTGDVEVLRAKVCYTALQAHLGELVVVLTRTHALDEAAAWRRVRGLVDEVYAQLRTEPAAALWARADHAFLTAPVVPHKALVRMRLHPAGGDHYVPVPNALRDAA